MKLLNMIMNKLIINFFKIKFSHFSIILVIINLFFLTGCNKKEENINNINNINTQPQVAIIPSENKENSPLSIQENQPFVIKINRLTKEMKIFNNQGSQIIKTSIGIGRGGLKNKTHMMDLITPIGEMEVDIILYKDENFSQISPQLKEKYLSSDFKNFVENNQGLKELFSNMNIIDFDSNGKPDNSYGIAYIGLNPASNQNIVTGPKMRYANWQGGGNIPYWFSIALHGTPREEKDLGAANSGGCIHVSGDILLEIIETGIINIGTKVIITDDNI